MGELLDLVSKHESEDVAREQKLSETQALLDDRQAKLDAALAENAADEDEISKLQAEVAVLEQFKKEHSTAGPIELPPNPPTLPASSRFPGDPGEGKYRLGIAMGPSYGTVAAAKKMPEWTDKVTYIHNYASSGAKCLDHGKIKMAADANLKGVSQSFKCNGISAATPLARFQYITSGKNDAEIRLSAKFCKTFPNLFIWLTLHHEPEDDFADAATQAEFRRATRHTVAIFREEGVTNVAWQPIFMAPYSFSAKYKSGRDFRKWHPDWNGTSWESDAMMDLFGSDVYNPLIGASTWHNYSEMMGETQAVTSKAGMPSRPSTHMEFGEGRTTGDWAAYGRDARDYAAKHDVVAFTYWNHSADKGRYGLDSASDPTGKKIQGWKAISDGAVV